MISLNRVLGHLFPWMAISGLLLAGWGLIITPDEIKGDAQGALHGMYGDISGGGLESSTMLSSTGVDVAAN